MSNRVPTRVSRFLWVLFLCAASSSVAHGQADTTRPGPRANSLVKGAWALQFAITRDFTLSSFEGATISVKKHTSPGAAYRVGLDLRWNTGNDEMTENRDTTKRIAPSESNQTLIGMVVHRMSYPSPTGRLALYWGVGPTASYSHSWSHWKSEPAQSGSASTEYTTDEWSTGVSVILGTEWFASHNIALLAQYGSAIRYESRKRTSLERWTYGETTTLTKRIETHKAGKFEPFAVKFGLSVYW